MHSRFTLGVGAAAVLVLSACHRPPSATQASMRSAERTIFNDSALHAAKCEAPKAGEDWHRVCTPLDQGMPMARPKPPNQP
jgi:hypothetical protein